jgi:lincosamide nucleotidyltransferase A/C/D/E
MDKYTEKKQRNQVFQKFIKRHVKEGQMDLIRECNTFLSFVADKTLEKQKLHKSNLCKNRFCPVCAWRKARKVIQKLEDIGYKIEVDWMPSRMELKHEEYGYLDIHPINLNDDGSITQANPEGGNYVFQNDWFSETNYKGRKIPCISKEAQLLFHSGYDLTEKDHFDIKNLKSIT